MGQRVLIIVVRLDRLKKRTLQSLQSFFIEEPKMYVNNIIHNQTFKTTKSFCF